MKNNQDYIYEYSDLNLFQTRVKLLTGDYKDVILEFGGSYVVQSNDVQDFTFEYTLYDKPDNLLNVTLLGNKHFEEHLKTVLISIINDRKNDRSAHTKLMQAASSWGVTETNIKIDERFYEKNSFN